MHLALGNLSTAVAAQSDAITANTAQIASSIASLTTLVDGLQTSAAHSVADVAEIHNLSNAVAESTTGVINTTNTLSAATTSLETPPAS